MIETAQRPRDRRADAGTVLARAGADRNQVRDLYRFGVGKETGVVQVHGAEVLKAFKRADRRRFVAVLVGHVDRYLKEPAGGEHGQFSHQAVHPFDARQTQGFGQRQIVRVRDAEFVFCV